MTELAPGWELTEEESTRIHWVGACRDVVMIFAYEGSHEDVGHILAGSRLVERISRELGPTVKLLFVVPPHHAKPPNARVRAALVKVAPRQQQHVSRIAVVIAATGFGGAIHRGATAGVLALIRPRVPVKVHSHSTMGSTFSLEPMPKAFPHCSATAKRS